jgi:hypothetical protein
MKFISIILFFLSFHTINAQRRIILWMDAEANFERLSAQDSIRFYFDKCKSIGVTDIVVDVKAITGEVLYKSKYAPQMLDWKAFVRKQDFDWLAFCIAEAHKRKLIIHASLNIFSAGHNYFDRGVVYTTHPEWQSINYTDSGMKFISQLKTKYATMTNPCNPFVQAHELQVLKELVTNYTALDGVVLDRARYDGIEADFSALSKTQFEKYIGQKIEDFPNAIFSYAKNDSGIVTKAKGRLYKQWLEWRASVIYHFFKKARAVVKKANPKILFGDYTGAWYPLYYEVGVNWASKNFDVAKEYDWATKKYQAFGYAELLDVYMSGCYFYEVNKEEVLKNNKAGKGKLESGRMVDKEEWYSVEGSAEIAVRVTNNHKTLYGSLYVEQYENNAEQFMRAAKMCLQKTNGLMIFDLVHVVQKDWWEELKKVIMN